MPATASATDILVLGLVAELGDGADDDDVNPGELTEARGGSGIGAVGVGKILLGHELIQGLALEDGVGAVFDQVGDDQVGDSFTQVDVGAKEGG